MLETNSHIPVMLNEMLEFMSAKDGEVIVDGTFGAGGYSRALLKSSNCKIIAIDRDPDVKIYADKLADKFPGRIKFINGRFGDMEELLHNHNIEHIDGIVLDVGVSSMQIDQGERGFSFMHDGTLDMRMEKSGTSAAELVNSLEENELADIIFNFGGERKSRKIARAIVMARKIKKIVSTNELAEIIRNVVHKSKDKIDPATRTFQALRIFVNDEINQLKQALNASEKLLKEGGRLVIASFHSLEDELVKKFLNEKSGKQINNSRYLPEIKHEVEISFKLLKRKALKPTEDEIQKNIRARSARMRAAIKV